jgi:hypothetical protein
VGFDFKIEYKPGKENIAADALSRVMMLTWSERQTQFLQELRETLMKDKTLKELMATCQQQGSSKENYTSREGLLFRKGRLVVPTDEPRVSGENT